MAHVDLELPSREIFQRAARFKGHRIGIKCLRRISHFSVRRVLCVFSLAEERMPDVRHVRSYLVRSSRDELYLKESEVVLLTV